VLWAITVRYLGSTSGRSRNTKIDEFSRSQKMNLKSFLDNPEELFIGACLQFPLYFIVGWWVIPIMIACGVMWRLGGWEFGNKFFRRLGVPILVCGATLLTLHNVAILLAVPFMVWLCPASYGKESWLYKWLKNDFLVRSILYAWYWVTFSVAMLIKLG
jgi:hypothetical protein